MAGRREAHGTRPAHSIVLPIDHTVARQARAFVADALRDLGRGDLAEVGSLLVSELVTNVARHTDVPSCAVRLGPSGEAVDVMPGPAITVEVGDAATDLAVGTAPPAGAGDESGRGLRIVASLADDWGVRRTEDEKSVWFQLGG